jgi:hypothetical protein
MYKTNLKNPESHSLLYVFLIIFILFQVEYSIGQTEHVILDTDMGSDCDDVGALALLHHFADEGTVEILGLIYSSGKVPYGVGVIDAINHYYGRPHLPVGASHDLTFGDPVDKMLAEKLAKDTAAFKNRLIHNYDALEQTFLNRKLLMEAADNAVTYITIGHTKGLFELLKSEPDHISPMGGLELVTKKVKRWVALGALGAANAEGKRTKDWNFFYNNTAFYTDFLIRNFPGHAYFIDAGSQVYTGGALENLEVGNILRTAYRDWLWNVEGKVIADQRPSWDLAAVYYAIKGNGLFLQDAGPGSLEFDPEEGCRWVSGKINPRHHFITQRKNVENSFADYLNQAISVSPKNSILK